ncbi:MAG: GrpB family protein [Candidatus Taylorbacteria bacterium]|nr:GrpB family protein [Candidatus Taylorbacteria bacterium]
MAFMYKEYQGDYSDHFQEMKEKILALSRRKLQIEHIGSTAVKGLGGKGIIDISIGIRHWSESSDVLKILNKLGFKHFHDKENNTIFVSTKARCEEGEYHVHISRIGTMRYTHTLEFRDFLRAHPAEVKNYQQIKKGIFKKCKGDRKLYKQLKNNYFINLKNCFLP